MGLVNVGQMYGFTYIYHKFRPNLGKYNMTMDPMGIGLVLGFFDFFPSSKTNIVPENGPGPQKGKVCLPTSNYTFLWVSC